LGLLDLPGDRRHGPPIERDEDVRGDLDPELVLADLPDDGVEPAGRDHLVTEVERVLHRPVRLLTPPARHDEREPREDEQQDDDQEEADVSRSSASRL
jgi:hypothetical protein